MPERAIVTQGVQIGVESTPGTTVPANKQFQSVSVAPEIHVDTNNYQPVGQKVDSIVVPGKEWAEANISGVLDYSEIIYLLSGILQSVAGVQNGATTAYTWTFVPLARGADTVKTFTVEQGDANRAQRFSYGVMDELTLKLNRQECTVDGKMFAQAVADNIALTGAPTAIVQKPVIPNNVDVYIDPTSGALGTTKMTRMLETTLHITNRFNPVWAMNSANASFASHVETDPAVTLEVMMEADAQGMALLSTLRAGATHFIRIKATSPDLAGTAFPFSLTIDAACKVAAISPYSDQDGIYAITFTNNLVYDATWAKYLSVIAVNQQVTL